MTSRSENSEGVNASRLRVRGCLTVYSFNGEGLWLNKSGGERERIGEAGNLSRWQELNSRLTESLRP